MRCNENRVRIKRMQWVDGVLVTPQSGEAYSIRVESCSCRNYYRLNEMNHFCVEIEHLSKDEICIYEDVVGSDVVYFVDGAEKEEGCISFEDTNFHEVIIVNKEESLNTATLYIKKQVVSQCHEEMEAYESFTFEMVGNDFYKNFVLNKANNYEINIEKIPFGKYEVKELHASGYDVVYFVDDVESEDGKISLFSPYQQMRIENHRKDEMHVVRISKWIQMDGKLVKPHYAQKYDIVVDDGYAMREYSLACHNRYVVELEGNYTDLFKITELNASTNVLYEVDGTYVDEVEISMHEDHEVRIINAMVDTGSLLIQKWMKEDGRLIMPNMNSSFEVKIHGLDEMTYILNKENDFTLLIEDVNEGFYEIEEINVGGYDILYEVNGIAKENGQIEVKKGNLTSVNIMNVEKMVENSNLHLQKKMYDVNGNISDVKNGSYEIVIENEKETQTVVLDESNAYAMDLSLESGWYHIYELHASGDVKYQVDGVDHHEKVYMYIDKMPHKVLVLNSNSTIYYEF